MVHQRPQNTNRTFETISADSAGWTGRRRFSCFHRGRRPGEPLHRSPRPPVHPRIIVASILHPLHVRRRGSAGGSPRSSRPWPRCSSCSCRSGYVTFVLVRDLWAVSRDETGVATEHIETSIADLTGRAGRPPGAGRFARPGAVRPAVRQPLGAGVVRRDLLDGARTVSRRLPPPGRRGLRRVGHRTVPATTALCDRMFNATGRVRN